MEYKIRVSTPSFLSQEKSFVRIRWDAEHEVDALDVAPFYRKDRCWDMEISPLGSAGKFFSVKLAMSSPYTSGTSVNREPPRRPARMTKRAAGDYMRAVESHEQLMATHPLLAGRLRMDQDGSFELSIPGIERFGLVFAVRVRDAAERGLEALLSRGA